MTDIIEEKVGKSSEVCQEDTFDLVFSKLNVGSVRNYAKFSSVIGWFSLIALHIYFSGYFATQRHVSMAIESEGDRITLTRIDFDEEKKDEKESSEDEYAITKALAIMQQHNEKSEVNLESIQIQKIQRSPEGKIDFYS